MSTLFYIPSDTVENFVILRLETQKGYLAFFAFPIPGPGILAL